MEALYLMLPDGLAKAMIVREEIVLDAYAPGIHAPLDDFKHLDERERNELLAGKRIETASIVRINPS